METDNTRLENQTRCKKNEAEECAKDHLFRVVEPMSPVISHDKRRETISSRPNLSQEASREIRHLLLVAVNLGRRSIDRSIDPQMLESVNHLYKSTQLRNGSLLIFLNFFSVFTCRFLRSLENKPEINCDHREYRTFLHTIM